MYGCAFPEATNSKSSAVDTRRRLRRLYRRAFAHFGPLHWWPGETPLEVCVGAILTQNTAWTNVEKAIANLKAARLLSVRAIDKCERSKLAQAIRPSGYYNQKAIKLKAFCAHIIARHGGSLGRLLAQQIGPLRRELLSLPGVGPETADSMILYAAEKPIFVVDAYTRRIVSRMGLASPDVSYEDLQELFHRYLKRDVAFYNEFHAQIVYVGKDFCRKQNPRCTECPNSLHGASGTR